MLPAILRDVPRSFALSVALTLPTVFVAARRTPYLLGSLCSRRRLQRRRDHLYLGGAKLSFLNFGALPITFGIGVDYAMNVVQRHAADGEKDAIETLRTSGGAVVLCLTTMLGYVALLAPHNGAIRSLGAIAAIGEVSCLLAAVLVTPCRRGQAMGSRHPLTSGGGRSDQIRVNRRSFFSFRLSEPGLGGSVERHEHLILLAVAVVLLAMAFRDRLQKKHAIISNFPIIGRFRFWLESLGGSANRVVGDIISKGGRATAVQGDVSRAPEVQRLFEETKSSFGRINILINNAGIGRFGPLEAMAEVVYRRLFYVNVLGTLLTTREAVRHFGPEGGSVINIGAMQSVTPTPGSLVYAATKYAIATMTRALALELGNRKIRVNTLAPGAVETKATRRAGIMEDDAAKREILARTPLGRIGQPEDVARIAVFLASDEAGWLTGAFIPASGGLG